MNFKPKRVSGAELGSPAVISNRKSARGGAGAVDRAGGHKAATTACSPTNFKASEAFADLIAREAETAGSTRRLFARLMRDAG